MLLLVFGYDFSGHKEGGLEGLPVGGVELVEGEDEGGEDEFDLFRVHEGFSGW